VRECGGRRIKEGDCIRGKDEVEVEDGGRKSRGAGESAVWGGRPK